MADNKEQVKQELKIHINTDVSPIYADDIVQFNFEKGVAKILLAQRFQDSLTHTNTVAIPLETVLGLRELLNSDAFNEAVNSFLGTDKLKK